MGHSSTAISVGDDFIAFAQRSKDAAEQGFTSGQQRRQLDSLKNSLKNKLGGKQREKFKEAIEDEKIGEQFLDPEALIRIFNEIIEDFKP